MAQINVNLLVRVRMVRIDGLFHKLPLEIISRESFENRGLSAPSAPSRFMAMIRCTQ